jgi:hypothetical protein
MDPRLPVTPPPLRLLESRRRAPPVLPTPASQAWWLRWLVWPATRGR